jgi:5-methylcytosine-specific restriction endonuclease McrA
MSQNKGRNSRQKRVLRQRLYTKSKKCCHCNRSLSLETATLEHVIALSAGGDWSIGNLRLACKNCNEERGSSDFLKFKHKKANGNNATDAWRTD